MRLFFLLAWSFMTTVFSVSAQGISMSPTRLFFTGNPGETVTETVILHNSSESDYTFDVNYKDWERAIDGGKIYYNADTLASSNASWLSTIENSVTVTAGTTKEIAVTMKIPANASSSEVTNSMMFFTQISKQHDKATVKHGIGIIALFEFGLHVYYTPSSNEIKSLDITNIEQIENKKTAVSITNDGNTINDATVEFEMTNMETGQEIKLKPISISMMPNTHQIVEFKMPENISGDFLGVTIIKMAGSNDLRVGEKELKF